MRKLFLLFAFMASTIISFAAVPEDQFAFVSNQDGSSVGLAKISSHQTLEYSLDGVTWGNMTTETTFSLSTDVVLYVRGKLTGNNSSTDYTNFSIIGSVEVKGNINYLWDYDNLNAPLKTCCGCSLFRNCLGLSDANNLELPATILSSECYIDMFWGCTNLTHSPSLPATELAYHCYCSMFRDCSSMASAPSLPSMKLANNCYTSMFQNCAALTNAPSLPAIELQAYCYYGMFSGCTSLTTAPELPAIELQAYCYYGMFSGCTSLTTAPELHASEMKNHCYELMFYGCTNLTTAPQLSATTLAYGCYQQMFQSCTSLTTPPNLPSTTLATNCYRGMFQECSNLTTPPCLPATTLADSCYRSMFYKCLLMERAPMLPAKILTNQCYYAMFSRCSNLKYIKCLATDISASECTAGWVYNVASSGTFVKHVDTNWSTTGTAGIPSEWTAQTCRPFTINFDANGGLIPTNGKINLVQGHPYDVSYLAPDQKTGYVVVYNSATSFSQLRDDCPTRDGHTFLGWFTATAGGTQVYDNVGLYKTGDYWTNDGKWKGTEDMQLYAQWSVNSYTITWLQDDGSLIDKTVVPYGQIPTHVVPTKEPTAEFTYTFAGWAPEVVAVTDNATYIATYTATPITTNIQNVTSSEKQATKTIRNGQLLIQQGDKTFNAQGARVK